MDNSVDLALMGVIVTVVGLLGLIVKFFVTELKASRLEHSVLTEKFIKIAEENTEARIHLSNSIDANTRATETGVDIAKKSNDNLTKLMLKVLKSERK